MTEEGREIRASHVPRSATSQKRELFRRATQYHWTTTSASPMLGVTRTCILKAHRASFSNWSTDTEWSMETRLKRAWDLSSESSRFCFEMDCKAPISSEKEHSGLEQQRKIDNFIL